MKFSIAAILSCLVLASAADFEFDNHQSTVIGKRAYEHGYYVALQARKAEAEAYGDEEEIALAGHKLYKVGRASAW